MENEELKTYEKLFFGLSEAFDEMYGYVTELYEMNLGIECEQYSEEEITEFVENTNDNAKAVYEKWNKIIHLRIEKAIVDNNPTLPIRKYTEFGTYKNLPTLKNDMMAAQNMAAHMKKNENPYE